MKMKRREFLRESAFTTGGFMIAGGSQFAEAASPLRPGGISRAAAQSRILTLRQLDSVNRLTVVLIIDTKQE